MEIPVLFYQTTDGLTTVEVNFNEDTVWLTQAQIAELYGTQRPAITKHLNNIFKSEELAEQVVCSILERTATDSKTYKTQFYNLDAIISVGYRVNSKRATQFRTWANRVLKEHLIKGYTLNENRLKQQQQSIFNIQQTLLQFSQPVNSEEFSVQEAKGLLALVTEYAKSFSLLNQFDTDEVDTTGVGDEVEYELDYDEALTAVTELKRELMAKHEASDLFGKIRDDGFRGILGSVSQTFGGNYAYPTIEEQAANLLYFIIKNHPFADGNKRIGAFVAVGF